VKITAIRTTPLYCRLKQPYHRSQGVKEGTEIVLVEIETDIGVTGVGKVLVAPNNAAKIAVIDYWRPAIVGSSVYDIKRLSARCNQLGFVANGAGSAPRYFAQCFAGIEFALWDAIGKERGLPVHKLLGGPVSEAVSYFGFVQGNTTDELVASADEYCHYTAIRDGSADLIVLGLHETGGIEGMIKAASVGEAGAVNICNHAVVESGITTREFNQATA
jgi:muconate cycloisomerase